MFGKRRDLAASFFLGLLVSTASAVPLHARSNSTLSGVAAWWGQDNGVSLDEVCGESSFKIVILSFVNTFFAAGGYPGMNMNYLNGPSNAQTAAGATDLLDGSPLVPAIQKCQAAGKKVFISLGGGGASSALSGDTQGQQFADTIWNLFLGGTQDSALRPFQGVTLDGIDLDNENNDPTGYLALVNQMRSNMNSDTSKQYYISAAPQCPRPDASLSDDILVQTDMVWVQFYNNQEAGCCNGQTGFISSLQAWSQAVKPAQIWIGAPGVASAVDDGGYISASQMQSQIAQVKQLGLPNFGGVALWDAEVSVQNGNYQDAVASALAGSSSSSSKRKNSSGWVFGRSKAKKTRHIQA